MKKVDDEMPAGILWFIGLMLILVIVFPLIARADANVTLNWTQPIECTNGESVGSETCGALTRTRLECASNSGGPYEFVWGIEASRITDTRSYVDGEYYCILKTRNAAGWSDASNEIHFTVTTPAPTPVVPNPPSSITIEVQP